MNVKGECPFCDLANELELRSDIKKSLERCAGCGKAYWFFHRELEARPFPTWISTGEKRKEGA